jgi:hypothetical protein
MDRVLFGDNQFFGINHRSYEKANVLSGLYSTDDSIIRVLEDVKAIGINTFMCTTHERLESVFDKMKINDCLRNMKIIPCMPYAHKYANAVTELGILGGIQKYLPGGVLSAGVRGAKVLLSSDYTEVMRLLVDAEMHMLKGLNVEAIFLQNIVTDLLLGLNMTEFFSAFYDYIVKKYKVDVGFITMNYAYAQKEIVIKLGCSDAIICSPVNKIGYRMNPSRGEVEAIIRQRKNRSVAMSIFASGAIKAQEAISYINQLDGIDSVLFGASNIDHIRYTFENLKK